MIEYKNRVVMELLQLLYFGRCFNYMRENQTCCFLGHRDASEKIRPLLYIEIEKHIAQHNVTTFYVGGYGNFDHMSVTVLNEMKKSTHI